MWRLSMRTYANHTLRGFMDDAKLVNGRDWIELFGGRRFEITAPRNGYLLLDPKMKKLWDPKATECGL